MADLPCPNCGSPLAFLEQYQRHYCLRCGQYAPEGYGDRGAKHCPTCGGILSFVTQYNRYYCYHCNLYPPEETTGPAVATPAGSPAPAVAPTPAAAASAPATAEPAAPPSAPEATLVAATTPAAIVPAAPTPTPQEAKPTPIAEPEPKPAPAAEPAPIPEKPAEPAPQEPSPEIRKLAASKPAVVRVKIFTLKKSELIDLCKAYDLDPSGTKEQVQERLLSYLHDLESEETPSEEPQPSPQPVPAGIEPEPIHVATTVPKAEPVSEPAAASGTATTNVATAAVVQLERPEPEAVSEAPAPIVVEVPRAAPKIEHPCPTCGRELTFISQYDRYYCYFCQRYAPVARVKGACPTCGAAMRWIDRHQRWWCDSCQKYASADLPKPTNGAFAMATPRPAVAATTVATSRPAVVIHHHASPAVGMGLIGFGLALWIIYEVLGVLAPAMSLAINNPFTGSLGDFMVFFAFIFVAAGALLGLSNLRDRF